MKIDELTRFDASLPAKGNVPDWIVGSRRMLNVALGKTESYSDYLERLRDSGELEMERRGGKFAIRFPRDPGRHAAVRAAFDKGRTRARGRTRP